MSPLNKGMRTEPVRSHLGYLYRIHAESGPVVTIVREAATKDNFNVISLLNFALIELIKS